VSLTLLQKFTALEKFYVELSEHNPQLPADFYVGMWLGFAHRGQHALIVDSLAQVPCMKVYAYMNMRTVCAVP
jgi:hypothetical protein